MGGPVSAVKFIRAGDWLIPLSRESAILWVHKTGASTVFVKYWTGDGIDIDVPIDAAETALEQAYQEARIEETYAHQADPTPPSPVG